MNLASGQEEGNMETPVYKTPEILNNKCFGCVFSDEHIKCPSEALLICNEEPVIFRIDAELTTFKILNP